MNQIKSLAGVLAVSALTSARMQSIEAWTELAETCDVNNTKCGIDSYLEDVKDKYNEDLEIERLQLDIPMVGILTMPTNPAWKSDSFQWDHYSWEHNVNYIHYGGTYASIVKFDLEDEELYHILDGLNGVYFTGGPLDLIDPETLE